MKIITLCITLMLAASALAQRTTRPGLKVDSQTANAIHAADTIRSPRLLLSGYEKTLKSSKESIMVTNEGTDTIGFLEITIDYLDLQGRQLHRRDVPLQCPESICPGQTRMFEFKSWDSQKVWYYRLSEPPHTKSQATPYDIKARVAYALRPTL